MVAPIDDQEILDTADDEQLALPHEAEIAGPQPWPLWGACRRGDKRRVQRQLGLSGFLPVAGSDVGSVHPDFTGGSLRTLDPGVGIDDAHDRRPRYAVTDQRCTASA